MKRIIFLIAFASGLIFIKCTPTKMASGSSPTVIRGVSDATALLEIARATDLPYAWFVGTGTGTIDLEDQRISAKLNVRIRHDSVIWVQISKLGVELGRMLVRPDSAFFVNRIEHSYARHATNEFFRKYNLPADFSMFAKVFTGGAYLPPSITNTEIEADGALFVESSTGVNARHWLDTDRQLIRSMVVDPNRHQWSTTYAGYQQVNTGQIFPFRRGNSLMIDGKANLFDVEYSSILIDIPHELPFSIPSHYEKM